MASNTYSIKKDGGIHTEIMSEHLSTVRSADSGWEHPAASIIIMAVCAVLDSVMFYQLFSSFLYDSPAVQFLSIIAMLVGFDLAPIYLGIVVKKNVQGMDSSKLVPIILGISIGLAIVLNIVLRITTRGYVLPNFGIYDESEHATLSFVYSVFAGTLPIITSLVSFAVSYINSNPVKAKLINEYKDKMLLEEAIIQYEGILKEYSYIENYFEQLEVADIERYNNAISELYAYGQYYKDYVREQIAEFLGEPTSTNILTRDPIRNNVQSNKIEFHQNMINVANMRSQKQFSLDMDKEVS